MSTTMMILFLITQTIKLILHIILLTSKNPNKAVGIFHPFTNDGGGGERVLWCAVYTGDHDATPESLARRTVDRFGVELVSPPKLFTGRRKPQLVLLDHGLYKVFDNSIMTNYAALWKALVLADANGIKDNCLKLGAGEDLYALFAGILTMRPWNRVIDPAVDHLTIQGNVGDHSELQMYASLYFPQITELLHKLPRVILLMLKTNDCLRSVNNALIKRPSVESFIIIGRVSYEALIAEKVITCKVSL